MANKKRKNENGQDSGSVKKLKTTDEKWICPVCKKTFKKGHEKQHLDKHLKYSECPMCSETLTRKDALKRHINKKHALQAKRCRWCDEELKAKGSILTPQTEFPGSDALTNHIWESHVKRIQEPPPQQMVAINLKVPADDAQKTLQETKANKIGSSSVELVSSSDEDDNPMDVTVPETTLRGPSKSELSITNNISTNYDEYNESYNEIPKTILDNILAQLPEPTHSIIKSNWRLIRSFQNANATKITSEHNRRLIGNEEGVSLQQYFREQIHAKQSTAYRVISSPGYILQNIEEPNEYRHFVPHRNNNNIQITPMANADDQQEQIGEQVDTDFNGCQPFLIKDNSTLEHYLNHLDHQSIIDSTSRPDTKWRLLPNILNIHFWIIHLVDRPIACGSCTIPKYLKRNPYVKTFLQNTNTGNGYMFNDHLCVFRIITHVLDDGIVEPTQVKERYYQWIAISGRFDSEVQKFRGVHYTELSSVEDLFNIRFNIYQMQEDKTILLIRRSPEHPSRKLINVDLHQMEDVSHFSLILDIEKYGKKWFCNFCNKKFTRSYNLLQHRIKLRCSRGIAKKTYPGGVHQEKKNIFHRLKLIGVPVRPDVPNYNRYFGVYDYESLLQSVKVDELDKELKETESLHIIRPSTDGEEETKALKRYGIPIQTIDGDGKEVKSRKLQFFQAHQPISFSILSNVPGYDNEPFTVIEADTEKLVETFVTRIEEIAEARKALLLQEYSFEIGAIEEKVRVAKLIVMTKRANDENTTLATYHFKKVRGILMEFRSWLAQMPMIGYNSGKYDLPLIKEYLFPALVQRARSAMDTNRIFDFDQRVAKSLRLPTLPKRIVMEKSKVDEEEEEEEDKDEEGVESDMESDVRGFFTSEVYVDNTGNDDDKEDEYMEEDDDNDTELLLPEENPAVKLKGLPSITKKGTAIMSVRTKDVIFLDQSLYLAAGTSLDNFQRAWMKADERLAEPDEFGKIELVKLPFPYSFLDSVEKLEYEGVPPFEAFYNHLKGCNITTEEYATVERIYRDEAIIYFKDYLALYNATDVKPFLQSCEKQFHQYWTETGIDMYKECISLPGITLKYLHRNTKNYQFALWGKGDGPLHEELRKDMTGGLSLVMNRLAIAGETIIRGEELVEGKRAPEDFHKVKTIQGYDANALYLWAVKQEMPVGFHTLWELDEDDMKLKKIRDAKPHSAEWLQYESEKIGHEIINKHTHGFEERIGELGIPVDGYCEVTDTVYEFDGCWWHAHTSAECKAGGYDKNTCTNKTSEDYMFEREERIKYIESLGKKFVSMWECEWLEQRKKPKVIEILLRLNRKYAYRFDVSHTKMVKTIKRDEIFGFCQVSMELPEHLQKLHHFKDFPPIIKNAMIGRESLSPHMLQHCEKNDLLKQPRRSLISSFKAEKQWFLTSMVHYLVSQGVVIKKVHKVLQYDRAKPFEWFANIVTLARQNADSDLALEILGQAYKLLGNTAYGKSITRLEDHTDAYIVPLRIARELANDPFLISLEPIRNTECYEVVLRKRKVKLNLPEQIGMAVYNWAKIRMFQFAYNFLGKFCDPYMYSWMQTDTDSSYLMLAGDTVADIIHPHMRVQFEVEKGAWLVQCPADKRTPGLFKLEYSGIKMVCLCSKTYQVVGSDGGYKSATKGLNKNSQFEFEHFKKVLDDQKSGRGFNVGFQKNRVGKTCTYICEREALSYLYAKRFVADNGIHTENLHNV